MKNSAEKKREGGSSLGEPFKQVNIALKENSWRSRCGTYENKEPSKRRTGPGTKKKRGKVNV